MSVLQYRTAIYRIVLALLFIFPISAKEKSGFEELFLEMNKVSNNKKSSMIKSKISLSYAWESLLWKHKDIDVIIKKLEANEITLDDAITLLKEGL